MAPVAPTTAERIHALYSTLLLTFVLLLVFLVGSYIMMRIGRWFIRRPSASRTRYTDAWSQYRLTDEQIQQATSEPDADNPSGPHS
jgi:hypothetical protein